MLTVLPLAATVAVGFLHVFPKPGLPAGIHLLDFFLPVIPFGVLTGIVALLVLAASAIKRKSTRLKFVLSIASCYAVGTLLYLVWLSLGLLRYNTLPSGIILGVTWVSVISGICRRWADVLEMRSLLHTQVEEKRKELPQQE